MNVPLQRGFQLSEIIERLGGEVLGDAGTPVFRVASLDSAGPGDIAFVARRAFLSRLQSTRASALVLGREDARASSLPRIICDDPYAYFARLSSLLNPPRPFAAGIDSSAKIEPGARVASSAAVGAGCYVAAGARIGEDVVLGPGCFVGDDAAIGEGSRLHPGVVVMPGCVLGARALVRAAAVIGSDGFGIAMHEGRWIRIPQTGRVIIGDDVEVGAGTTIDRGTLDDTVIEDGVKLDNQIQVGHNVQIGAHTAMAGCVGIAGSTKIGRYCTVGGGSVILGHLEITDRVHISAGTVITKSISAPGTYSGVFPAQTNREWSRTAVLLRNISRLEARIRALEDAMTARGRHES